LILVRGWDLRCPFAEGRSVRRTESAEEVSMAQRVDRMPILIVPDLSGWRRDRLPEIPDAPWMSVVPDWTCDVMLSRSEERLDREVKTSTDPMQIPMAYHLHGGTMRTTLNIDDHALAEAVESSGGKTKTAVINEALRLYAKRNRVRRLADLRGKATWEGDLDALRKRVKRR
jgi:Arc/MetJ family transcription regulator